MRQADAGRLRAHRVPDLDAGKVRYIKTDGAREVAAELVALFIANAKEAATPRRVRPLTRAASMSTAGRALVDARHILQCDAKRADLSADARKRARDTLRKLPRDVPQLPDDKTAADIARDFAALAARAEYARDAARAVADFRARIAQPGTL